MKEAGGTSAKRHYWEVTAFLGWLDFIVVNYRPRQALPGILTAMKCKRSGRAALTCRALVAYISASSQRGMLSLAASPMLTAHSARFKPHKLPPFRWPAYTKSDKLFITQCIALNPFLSQSIHPSWFENNWKQIFQTTEPVLVFSLFALQMSQNFHKGRGDLWKVILIYPPKKKQQQKTPPPHTHKKTPLVVRGWSL